MAKSWKSLNIIVQSVKNSMENQSLGGFVISCKGSRKQFILQVYALLNAHNGVMPAGSYKSSVLAYASSLMGKFEQEIGKDFKLRFSAEEVTEGVAIRSKNGMFDSHQACLFSYSLIRYFKTKFA